MVSDEPQISRYTALPRWRAESNSIFDMAQLAGAQLVSTLEEPGPNVGRGGNPRPPWD